MEFRNSQSYRCFKSVCLWSLLTHLMIFFCFIIGYILAYAVGFLISSNFAQGFGWVAIVFPAIFLTLFSVICFALANGYLATIFYLEYFKNEQNLPLTIVDKTEQISDKIIKNNLVKNILIYISVISFVLNLLISVVNFYTILIGILTFFILLTIHKTKKHEN